MADENGVVIVANKRVREVMELAKKFKKIEVRIKREIRRGMRPVDAHESVGYDILTKGR